MSRIYVASSWRNQVQPVVVHALRELGHDVYDFRHPPGGDHLGFSWSDVDPNWRSWSVDEYLAALTHEIAEAGYESDYGAMLKSDTGVLVLPSGRSAHLEAGFLKGMHKRLYILLSPSEFNTGQDQTSATELMYKLADGIYASITELLKACGNARTPSSVAVHPQRWIDGEPCFCEGGWVTGPGAENVLREPGYTHSSVCQWIRENHE